MDKGEKMNPPKPLKPYAVHWGYEELEIARKEELAGELVFLEKDVRLWARQLAEELEKEVGCLNYETSTCALEADDKWEECWRCKKIKELLLVAGDEKNV